MKEVIPVKHGLFSSEGEGHLVGGYCPSCTRYHFPSSTTCPYCSAAGCAERQLSDRGTLNLFTAISNRPPGYRGELPFGFGVVELPEGLQVLSRLTEANLDRLHFGMPVRFVLTPLHVDEEGRQVISYAFAPETE